MLTRLQRLFTPEERTRLARAQSARFSCHTFRPMDSRQFAALSLLCGRFSTSRAILEPVRVPLDFFGGSILGLDRVQGCDTVVQVLAGPQTSAHTEAGICAEALVLMLTDLGMATCYLTGGFRRDYLPDLPRSLDRVCVICAGTGLETQPARRRKSLDRLSASVWIPRTAPGWTWASAWCTRSSPLTVPMSGACPRTGVIP